MSFLKGYVIVYKYKGSHFILTQLFSALLTEGFTSVITTLTRFSSMFETKKIQPYRNFIIEKIVTIVFTYTIFAQLDFLYNLSKRFICLPTIMPQKLQNSSTQTSSTNQPHPQPITKLQYFKKFLEDFQQLTHLQCLGFPWFGYTTLTSHNVLKLQDNLTIKAHKEILEKCFTTRNTLERGFCHCLGSIRFALTRIVVCTSVL